MHSCTGKKIKISGNSENAIKNKEELQGFKSLLCAGLGEGSATGMPLFPTWLAQRPPIH